MNKQITDEQVNSQAHSAALSQYGTEDHEEYVSTVNGFIMGFNEAIKELTPSCGATHPEDRKFNSLMETVNVIAGLYRHHEQSNAEKGLYKEAIEFKAKVEALEKIMKEAARICRMMAPSPPKQSEEGGQGE